MPKKSIKEENPNSSERTMAKLKDSLSKLRSHLDKLHKRDDINGHQRKYQLEYKKEEYGEGDDTKDESDSSVSTKK